MNITNEINLIDKPVKDQLLAVEEILESISSENSIEIITNEELLIKYIPPKAIEKKIKIKLKLKNENWHIHLEKE
ncbi:MAG: hypothetical protein CL711_00095 [Chloroflexi bacterium]|jgi:hypothetical protein|nr:MAG: hypothetical protein EGP09_06450 [SAR202 cluster bacterium]KAA1298470.1 MAG: hypothetical protein EGP06_04350 [SAR202 cluster bacterium]MAX11870.1 hypothetical protein [Chloroflexota bacterium]|tara:strand:- start:129 stop:353 length:225 start_codon:yes stop_codon:yes gene_type:complete